MLDQGVGPPKEGGGRGEKCGGAILEELKIGEIERNDKLWKDITGVFVEFITYDPKPYKKH